MEKTLTVDQAVEAFRVWMDDEFDIPSGSMTDSEEEGLRFRLNAFASPPTLHIGMGSGDCQMIRGYVMNSDLRPNFIRNGALTLFQREEHHARCKATLIVANSTHESTPFPLFANAHTKSVTVESIVKLAEEWDAYCVVTPTDPDGIEDFRARLLKLIQE